MPSTPPEHRTAEYDSERDMDGFWEAAMPKSEPFRQWWYLPILLLLIVFSVPWYRVAGSTGTIFHGLPVWMWTSLGCSLGVAVLTSFAILRYWKDGD